MVHRIVELECNRGPSSDGDGIARCTRVVVAGHSARGYGLDGRVVQRLADGGIGCEASGDDCREDVCKGNERLDDIMWDGKKFMRGRADTYSGQTPARRRGREGRSGR